MTVRFLLGGSFEQSHNELTVQVRRLRQNMPGLFKKLQPASERLPDDDNEATTTSLRTDATHLAPWVLAKLQSAHCRDILNLPTRGTSIDPELRQVISSAYQNDYGLIVSTMGSRPVRWYKKLSFTDRSVFPFISSDTMLIVIVLVCPNRVSLCHVSTSYHTTRFALDALNRSSRMKQPLEMYTSSARLSKQQHIL